MRLLALIASIFILPISLFSGSYDSALSDFKKTLDYKEFSSAELRNEILILHASSYAIINESGKKNDAIKTAGFLWLKTLNLNGIESKNTYIIVLLKDGGELWNITSSSVELMERWSDNKLFFDPVQTRSGRIFGFLGAQTTMGGDVKSSGINARLGSTLFKDRFDFSIFFSHNSYDSAGMNSYGVSLRALFPLTRKYGANLGVQLSKVSYEEGGESTNVTSILGGVNYYLPAGSFDITLLIGNNSTYSLIAGYTFYLTKK
ncbi:MAG: hypothetical protein K6357_06840 [Elusimicrobiota bacterium]